jgi:fructuronate reductase
LRPGIVHLGLGAFARAHLLPCNDDAVAATGDRRWGIVGVSLRSPAIRDALRPRGGRYRLTLRDGACEQTRDINSLIDLLHAPGEPQAVLEAIAHPDTRIVSLTVTEKGYLGSEPGSTIDWLLRGIELRCRRAGPPITLMSLDNLVGNGQRLRERLQAAALQRDARLAAWIADNVAFPCSMVDRIVPRSDEPLHLAAEPYFEWAIEDRFAAGRPAWQHGGARFVADVAPFEQRKLRMLNGAHSAIAYLGVAAGLSTVDQAIGRPALRGFIEALWREEIEPGLEGFDAAEGAAYRNALLARFGNPVLGHRLLQIAMDGSQKIPQRWLPVVAERLAAGLPIDRLGTAIAAWCRHLRGHDDAGRAYAIDDPLAAELQALHRRASTAPDHQAAAAVFVAFAPVFGRLAGDARLAAAVARGLKALPLQGVGRNASTTPTRRHQA